MIDAATLRVVSAEDQAADAKQADGVGAHRAGFEGDDQIAVWQSGAAPAGGSGAESEDLGVSGGVPELLCAVASTGEDGPVGADHDGTYGDFPKRSGGSGFVEGLLHRFGGHGGVL